MNEQKKITQLWPLGLILFAVVLDQVTKSLIVANLSLFENYGKGLISITHVLNPAVAFSFGHNFPQWARIVFFIVVPIIFLGVLLVYAHSRVLHKDYDLPLLQRVAVSSIVGGGLGNIIDRIFRPNGCVIDFIDVNFFGLFGFDRFPTFNIADCFVTCGAFLWIVLMLLEGRAERDDS